MLSDKATRFFLYFIIYAVGLLAALPVLAYPAGINVSGGMMAFRFMVSPLLLVLAGGGLLAQRGWAHRSGGLVLLLVDAYWVSTLYHEVGGGI